MSVELRPFQQKLEADVYAAWQTPNVRDVMGVSATGSGKTVVLSKLLNDESGASVAIAHRQELVSQISTALARNGVRHRLVGAKKGSNLIRVVSALHVAEFGYSFYDPNAKTGVGGVDTIIRMDAAQDPWFNQVRLVIQDESHHVLRDNKWGKAHAMFPMARGFLPTATPLRADGKGLGRWADGVVDAMVQAPSMRDIINMGYLTDYRIFAPPSDVDLTQVAVSQATGDFNAEQLRKAVHESHIVGDVVQQYLKLAPGKLGVTFAVDVDDATKIAMAFRAAGVPAEVVSAKTPDSVRAAILRRFKNREILQLVNVDLFGEGFDLPAIEVVSFARPTQSFALYSQQFGRVLRLMLSASELQGYNNLSDAQRRAVIAASAKPIGIVIDHVGNVVRHLGPPDRLIDWTRGLERRERKGSGPSDAIPLRVCSSWTEESGLEHTGCFLPYERIYKECPYCACPAPMPAERSAPEFVDGDLTEFDPQLLAVMRGEIARIDGPFYAPAGLSGYALAGAQNRHFDRQQAQTKLRNAIAWWAGVEAAKGHGESESYRRFYFQFGTDVAAAQTLGAREAGELAERVHADLAKYGIDGTVNAAAYFTNH